MVHGIKEIDILKLSNSQMVDQEIFAQCRMHITNLKALLDESVKHNERLIKIEERNKQTIEDLKKTIEEFGNQSHPTSVKIRLLLSCMRCGVEFDATLEFNKYSNMSPVFSCPSCGRHIASLLLTEMKKEDPEERKNLLKELKKALSLVEDIIPEDHWGASEAKMNAECSVQSIINKIEGGLKEETQCQD